MRSLACVLGLAVLAAGTMLLGGCGAPIDKETLALLPPAKATQLRVWSTNHCVVFDPRIHSMKTCPFLTYMPARSSLQGKEWANFAWSFYREKHFEEDHCTCATQIADELAGSGFEYR